MDLYKLGIQKSEHGLIIRFKGYDNTIHIIKILFYGIDSIFNITKLPYMSLPLTFASMLVYKQSIFYLNYKL